MPIKKHTKKQMSKTKIKTLEKYLKKKEDEFDIQKSKFIHDYFVNEMWGETINPKTQRPIK